MALAYCSIRAALSPVTGVTGGPDTVIAVVGTGFTYRETGTINIAAATDSGTVGHPFVLFARGTVSLDCADTTSVWTAVPDNSTMWRARVPAPATAVNQVFLTGVPYPYVLSDTSLADLPAGRCQIKADSDSVYVNFGSHPNWTSSVDPTATLGYITLRNSIVIAGSNVTVHGFTVRRSNDDGIHITGPIRNVTIAGCDVRGSYRQGIMPNSAASHHCTIRNNISSENGSYGIILPDANTDFSILRNTCAYNLSVLAYRPPFGTAIGRSGVNGIRLGDRSTALSDPILHHNHLLEGNVAHHNQDTGIEIRTNFTTSRYNQSWSNQDHGFDHLSCTTNSHIGDLAWGNNRDGMSFENNSHNNTLRNCVIANNGRDLDRNDWELEFDNASWHNLSSDYNVVWRVTSEPADTILINMRGGPQTPDSANANCIAYPDSCFGTLARFQTAFSPLEAHSQSGQPVFADSGTGNFIPLSTSSVLDAANSGATGYLPLDIRGYYRHDAQAREPNTGTGSINYADIGPYEFDAGETPVTPAITVLAGRWDLLVTWTSGQYSGDEATRFDLQVGGVSFANGTPAPSGGLQCFDFEVAECHSYDLLLKTYDANTFYEDLGDTVYKSTKCTGSIGYVCDENGFAVQQGDEESMTATLEDGRLSAPDVPASLELEVGPMGAGRAIGYGIPHAFAGSPLDLSVFDVAGRRVLTIDRRPRAAGRFTYPLGRASGGPPSAGVYFVRLRVGGQTLRKTLVIW